MPAPPRLPGNHVTVLFAPEDLSLVRGDLSAPSKGPFLFVRPFQKYAVGVLDVAKGQIVKGTENPAIDIFGDVFVLERGSGELGLYDVATNQLQSTAALPQGSLGRLRASAVSADSRQPATSNTEHKTGHRPRRQAVRRRKSIRLSSFGAAAATGRAARFGKIEPTGCLG